MRANHFCILSILVMLISAACLEGNIDYRVAFIGVDDPTLHETIEKNSQLIALQKSPPPTRAALQRRAENDINNVVKALHSKAYYNAAVTLSIDFSSEPVLVKVLIKKGEIYPFDAVEIYPKIGSEESFPYECVTTENLGISLGTPALPSVIIKAKNLIEETLGRYGFPYASVIDTEVIVDQRLQTVRVAYYVDAGPRLYFGSVSIIGNKTVLPAFIFRKLAWCRGEQYDPCKIEQSRRQLESSYLFRSVSIDYPDNPPESNNLPIDIHVEEAKMRTIGFGLSYTREPGPGLGGSFEWQHRNYMGMGEELDLRGGYWGRRQYASLSYLIPDWYRRRQSLLLLTQYDREKLEGYTADTYTIGAIVDRECSKCFQYSYGLKYEHILDSDIHEDYIHQLQPRCQEAFDVFKTPVETFWDCSNDLFNPTRGHTLKIEVVPTYQFRGDQFFYDKNIITFTKYRPLDRRCRFVFAYKTVIGSIFGPSKEKIPRSELFDAGTESLLRGYEYKTVSPLDNTNKPTGGRSMWINSAELRYRQNEEIGWVLFYDFGNVYSSIAPDVTKKILQSVGLGFRYFTPVAPIRIDVGIPLNPRPTLDIPRYQLYINVGQAF